MCRPSSRQRIAGERTVAININLLQAGGEQQSLFLISQFKKWEDGSRRMELSKLPRIAKALQLDAKALCAKALAEFYPLFHEALLGNGAMAATDSR
jgi:hypothetical protein